MKRLLQISVMFVLVSSMLFGQSIEKNEKTLPDANPDRIARDFFNGHQNNHFSKTNGVTGAAVTKEDVFYGKAAGDYFGYSAASAGDVNGDGYDDLIVGAYGNDDAGTSAGKAYIYYGGKSMDYVADVTLVGAAAYNYFGHSVSTAGDVNGDGYDDVIVGAYGNDDGGSSAGKAYVYFGGPAMDNTADVTMIGENGSDFFGFTVSSAGDVNGDGYDEVLISATGNDQGGTSAGKVYIYYGDATMDNTADLTIIGEAGGDNFGASLSTAGDMNGDGYDDVIIGAHNNDEAGNLAGKVYIYLGGASMDGTADLTMTGEAASNYFGYSVSSAGDINGDGFGDVIIGAYGNGDNGTSAGKVYIYFGGSTLDNTADVTIAGENGGDSFGWSVAAAGDVNGDGYGDVLVGSSGNDDNASGAGKAYLYFGSENMDTLADFTKLGEAENDQLGGCVSSAGDVNGDGYADILLGVYRNDDAGTDAGKVYLYMQKLNGSTNYANWTVEWNDLGYSYFGLKVLSAGDLNGDGYDDVLITSYIYHNSMGKVWIYFGGYDMDTSIDLEMNGENEMDEFGKSVSAIGDVNGDGYDDVIVSAPDYNSLGKVYIYFGGVSMDNTADITMTGEASGDDFGSRVASTGDVNGDGFDDVIVCARQNDDGGSGAGKVYIYFGGVSMDNTADIIMIGQAEGDNFGGGYSPGDLNGDGYDDVIASAKYNDEGGTDAGKAYIYFGGVSMDTTADITMLGDSAYARFGGGTYPAGDVNGDGYDDIIIGDMRNDEAGTDAGKAYIYFGGAAMDKIADISMTGEAEGDHFGGSVSSPGDVNGDGYDDVIITASLNDEGGSNTGKVYVFFGGATMDNIADVTMTGETSGDDFGASASFAGDVNGDGYDDIIVGAPYYNIYQDGKVYIYFSSAQSVKPGLYSVEDVPNDQGGYVRINWSRCAYDNARDRRVDKYIVYGSPRKINGEYAWQEIAEVNAAYKNYYSYTAKTNYDSTSQSNAVFYYSVSAFSSASGEIWTSGVKSAYSVDNLSPSAATYANAAQLDKNSVQVVWDKNSSDPDVSHYAVYRSLTSDFTPDASSFVVNTTDTTYLDTEPYDHQNSYYKIVTYDIHENKSNPSPQAVVYFDSSLPVTLTNFTAKVSSTTHNAIHIQFSTASEENILGFNILRSEKENEGYMLVSGYRDNDSLSSRGSGSYGYEYSWEDGKVQSGKTYWYKLESVGLNGGSIFYKPVSVKAEFLPVEFALNQNYPNPFNPTTTLDYQLPVASDVHLTVYNALGQKVRTLVSGYQQPGYYSITFDGAGLASGVYYYRLEAGSFMQIKKMMLVR